MVKETSKLYFIGMGLNGFKSCSLEALEILNEVENIYIENYTNFIRNDVPSSFNHLMHKIKPVKRSDLEENDQEFFNEIKNKKTAILISGDPFIATTHNSLRIKANKLGFESRIIHNTSIMSAAASISGLSSYRFGKTVTCPFTTNISEYPYEVIKSNKKVNAHTLVLLDIETETNEFLTVSDAILMLLDLEKEKKEKVFTKESITIGMARIGSENEHLSVGTPDFVIKNAWKEIGPPQALIICSNSLHFTEEEALKVLWEHQRISKE